MNSPRKANVAVFVSGGGTNLQALIDAEKEGRLSHARLALVVSNKVGAYALTRASQNGIPSETVTKKSCKSSEEFEEKLLNILNENHIDIIVLAGFLSVLSENFVRQFPKRIINIHPSLIPAFCGDGFYGLRVHEAALERGVKVTGATVHYVNEITDGGEIILQKAVRVMEGDTPEILQKRVMEQAEWKLLPAALEMVCRDYLA